MKRLGFILALLIAISPLCTSADTTFKIVPANHGTYRITMPWGTYVVVPTKGTNYWVGTPSDYEKARVANISSGFGERLSSVNIDPGAAGEFVEAYSYRTRVGDIGLDEIVPQIDFDMTVTGPGAALDRGVSVTWIQGSSANVYCIFYDTVTHRAIGSGDPEDVQQEWRNETFAAPKAWLTHPMLLVFFSKDRKPGVIALRSIAGADFDYTKARAASMRDLGTGDKDEQAHLKHILAVAPTVNATSRPRTQPQQASYSLITPAPAATVQLDWQSISLLSPNGTALDLLVADTPEKQEIGLTSQSALPPHHGMIFEFDHDQPVDFWMKGMSYPLDFVVLLMDGLVNGTYHLNAAPQGAPDAQVPRFSSSGKYVIALPAGEAAADGFASGQYVKLP